MGVNFVSLDVIVVVSVSKPEERKRKGDKDEHQWRYDTVNEAYELR